MTSMPAILDSTHHPVDGRMGVWVRPRWDHRAPPDRTAPMRATARSLPRRNGGGVAGRLRANRTPVPLLALFAEPHPREQDAPPRPSPWNPIVVPRRRRTQARIVASIAAFALVLSAVVPAWAAAGPTRLSDAAVSPLSGFPTTTIVRHGHRIGTAKERRRTGCGSRSAERRTR